MAPRQSRTRHTRHLRNTQTHHPGRKRHAVATQNHNQLHTNPPTRNIRKHEEAKEQRAAGQEAGIEGLWLRAGIGVGCCTKCYQNQTFHTQTHITRTRTQEVLQSSAKGHTSWDGGLNEQDCFCILVCITFIICLWFLYKLWWTVESSVKAPWLIIVLFCPLQE